MKDYFAALDIGSNSIKTSIVLAFDPSCTVRAKLSKVTRLGEGIGDGSLLPEAMERSCREIKHQIEWVRSNVKSCALVAVATSAVRDASNGNDFLAMVAEKSGLGSKPYLLSGEQEAQLTFAGACIPFKEKCMVMNADPGGGSTELAYGSSDGILHKYHSFQVGAVRWMERFGLENISSAEDRRNAFESALELFRKFAADVNEIPCLSITGGTAYSAVSLVRKEITGVKDLSYSVTEDMLLELSEMLGNMTVAERQRVPGMIIDRANVMPAALIILRALTVAFKVDSFTANPCGLRHGLFRAMQQGNLTPLLEF